LDSGRLLAIVSLPLPPPPPRAVDERDGRATLRGVETFVETGYTGLGDDGRADAGGGDSGASKSPPVAASLSSDKSSSRVVRLSISDGRGFERRDPRGLDDERRRRLLLVLVRSLIPMTDDTSYHKAVHK
jgi:hypothetical protein